MATEEQYLASSWWLLTVQGIASILFGLAAVFWPGLTLGLLVYIFAAYIIATGLITLIESLISIGRGQHWILGLLLGIAQLAVGVYLIRNPLVSFGVLVLLIGFSFIVGGVIRAVEAFAEKGLSSTARTLQLISAGLSLLVGVAVLMQPAASGVAFVWIIGLFALVSGPIAIALSLDVKSVDNGLKAVK